VIEATSIDLLVHLMTVGLAMILLTVSLNAYRKKRSEKFLFICAAFGLFAVKELLLFANIFYFGRPILTAVSHTLNLAIILLFFWGTVR